LKAFEEKVKKAREQIVEVMKDGAVDPNKWREKPEEDRQKVGEALKGILKELVELDHEDLQIGASYFRRFSALLLIVILAYLAAHVLWRPSGVNSMLVSNIAKRLRTVELLIGELAEIKAKAKAEAGTGAGGTPSNPEEQQGKITKALGELQKDIGEVEVSFQSIRLLGVVQSEAEGNKIDEKDSFPSFSRGLLADLESLNGAFLWSDRRGRWFEIAWWAEIGVLVGILFYVGGRLSQVTFAPEETAMFLTEVFVAPVVVPVIFFLFALTGITGISLGEMPIASNIGFAFIFGFAIRRTLGLLDIIKKRIFPDPEPAS
jgi:hypothetical protein